MGALLLSGCNGRSPSAKLREKLTLPEPTKVQTRPRETRLTAVDRGEEYTLTPHSLIPIAFNRQPEIKSSYQRFKSEEGRYDFFYSSRDSMTPKFSLSNDWDETTSAGETIQNRAHIAELSLEKRFFDTSELEIGIGHRMSEENEEFGRRPFVSARVRYPLWASRERLERTSEEIFRRSELNDAQLAFIQSVRWKLRHALNLYYQVIYQIHLGHAVRSWREDLENVLAQVGELSGKDRSADKRRLRAEITTTKASEASYDSLVEVLTARLKSACGIPFHAKIEIVEQEFDPFRNMSHEDLLRLGMETDPEIATLRNSMGNAQVQLDLARRGKWDVALLADGKSSLRGAGEYEGEADWAMSVGLEVSVIDSRVTGSLIRQAQADIERFGEAIAARENAIFTDTLEPLVRNETLGKNHTELTENLEKYRADYNAGLTAYLADELSIDDLLTRRGRFYSQEAEIASQGYYMGLNVSSLCSATGQFFELLSGSEESSGMRNTLQTTTHKLAGNPT